MECCRFFPSALCSGLFSHKLGGYPAGLGIGLQIDFKVGRGVECGALHRAVDDVGHSEERTFIVAESLVGHFVGRIEYARHVAAAVDGFVGKGQTAEFLCVGLEKLQTVGREEVEPAHARRVP